MSIHYDGLGWSLRGAGAVAFLGVAGAVVFALQHRSATAWFAAAACLLWSVSVLAWMRWHACPGELSWNGAQWHWQAESADQPRVCRVRLCLDFNHWLLVSVRPQGHMRAHWLWLQGRHRAHWHLVRAVLCSTGQP